jgi:hypothetical protein
MRLDFNMASCPAIPPQNPSQVNDNTAKLMEVAGIQACRTTQASTSGGASGTVSTILGGASVEAHFQTSDTSSIGCEQISVASNTYKQAVNNISCMLNQSSNVVHTNITGINSIIFEAGGDLTVECNPLTIKQNMVLKMISSINLSDKELSQVSNQCKAVVNSIVDAVQKSDVGFGATPQGAKAISDTQTDLSNNTSNNKIKQAITDIQTSMVGKNIISMKSGGNLLIKGSNCDLSQNMVIDMIASNILDNVVTNSVSNLTDTINTTKVSTVQESKAAGVDSLDTTARNIDAQGKSIQAGNPLNALFSGMSNMMIIGVIGAIILAVIYYFTQKKPSQDNMFNKFKSESSFDGFKLDDLSNLSPNNYYILITLMLIIIIILIRKYQNCKNPHKLINMRRTPRNTRTRNNC